MRLRTALSRLFDTHGRASRREYLGFLTVCLPVAFGVSLIPDHGWPLRVRAALVVLLVAALICVEVRRLHDIGRPGIDLLWGLVPVVGTLMVGWWTLQPGEGPNRFDPTVPGQRLRLPVRRRVRLDPEGNVIGHEYVDDWGNVIPDDQVQGRPSA